MAIDTKSFSQLIAEFRKLQAKDAITPESFWLHLTAARRPARHCRYFRHCRGYGIYADYGVGSNTPLGNSGDLGRDNKRKRRKWFSRKYFASVMNIQEFFADSLGQEFCHTISNALNPDIMRRSITI